MPTNQESTFVVSRSVRFTIPIASEMTQRVVKTISSRENQHSVKTAFLMDAGTVLKCVHQAPKSHGFQGRNACIRPSNAI